MASRSKASVTFFGRGPQAGIRAEAVRLDDCDRPRFELHTPTRHAPVSLGLLGEHHVSHALATAAVAHTLGMAAADVADTLSGAVATTGSRMQLHERADDVTVIYDAYNANPDSMTAATRALTSMGTDRRTARALAKLVLPVPGGPRRKPPSVALTPYRSAGAGSVGGSTIRRSTVSFSRSVPARAPQSPGGSTHPLSSASSPASLAPRCSTFSWKTGASRVRQSEFSSAESPVAPGARRS